MAKKLKIEDLVETKIMQYLGDLLINDISKELRGLYDLLFNKYKLKLADYLK